MRPEKKIENPLPFLADAAQAAESYLNARRKHLVISTELRAKREAKRVALGTGALTLGHLTLLMFFFWMSAAVYQAGVPAWIVAVICLAFFGTLTAGLGVMAKRTGRTPAQNRVQDSGDK